MRVNNFNAGPTILPEVALEEASAAVIEFNGLGMSILEISHRSKDFQAVMDEAVQLTRDLMKIGDDYDVLFLQGGASTQFAMVPMNLLNKGDKAGYVNTGTWSKKAIKEAKGLGDVEVLATSEDTTFNYIPKGYDIPGDLRYLHLTSNNTIYGTQYFDFPETNAPVVIDMSSDIYSRDIDFKQFDLIYAGAQKNMGPAGTTLVVIKKDLLREPDHHVPAMFSYETHIKGGSMFNTPPVFSIYVSMLTMRWLKNNGGLPAMEALNRKKADMLYTAIDSNPMFKGTVAKEDRSIMNVNFIMENRDLEPDFLQYAKEHQCVGLNGHRSVGGFRASMYNALPLASVEHLVELMNEYTRIKG